MDRITGLWNEILLIPLEDWLIAISILSAVVTIWKFVSWPWRRKKDKTKKEKKLSPEERLKVEREERAAAAEAEIDKRKDERSHQDVWVNPLSSDSFHIETDGTLGYITTCSTPIGVDHPTGLNIDIRGSDDHITFAQSYLNEIQEITDEAVKEKGKLGICKNYVHTDIDWFEHRFNWHSGEKSWLCTSCGHVHHSDSKPNECPRCSARKRCLDDVTKHRPKCYQQCNNCSHKSYEYTYWNCPKCGEKQSPCKLEGWENRRLTLKAIAELSKKPVILSGAMDATQFYAVSGTMPLPQYIRE